MATTRYPFDPPIDPGLPCEHCGDPLLAAAQVFDGGLAVSGLRQYEWIHGHGSAVCRPTTTARPYDGWHATKAMEAAEKARRVAEDALLDPTD